MKRIIPTVKIWCLPWDITQDQLLVLHNGIVKVMASISETGVDNERDMLNLFSPDLMTYGLGSEIKVELKDILQYNDIVRVKLPSHIGEFIVKMFPGAHVFCRVEFCNSDKKGYWSSV